MHAILLRSKILRKEDRSSYRGAVCLFTYRVQGQRHRPDVFYKGLVNGRFRVEVVTHGELGRGTGVGQQLKNPGRVKYSNPCCLPVNKKAPLEKVNHCLSNSRVVEPAIMVATNSIGSFEDRAGDPRERILLRGVVTNHRKNRYWIGRNGILAYHSCNYL